MKQFIAKAFFLFFLVVTLGLPIAALAQERGTPECLNEQITLDALNGALGEWYSLGGKPPGAGIMFGGFGDPRFQDPGWEKWEWTMYYRQLRSNDPGYVQRQVVSVHYMVNRNTGEIAQVKFKAL